MTLSPFYSHEVDPDDPRYLDRLSKWHWPYTCRCRTIDIRRKHGWTFDNIRNMFVCGNCRLPSGYRIEIGGEYTGECISCGDDFVVWRNTLDRSGYSLCGNCGGTNAAGKGQRTKDPNREDEE